MHCPEVCDSRVARWHRRYQASERGDARRKGESLHSYDRNHGSRHCQIYDRSALEGQECDQHAANGKLRTLPILEDAVVFLRRVPAQDFALPLAPDCVDFARRSRGAWVRQKTLDCTEIACYRDIREDARPEPQSEYKDCQPLNLLHVRIVADARICYRLAGGTTLFIRAYSTICP